MPPAVIDEADNRRKMLAGELYYAFTPDLTAQRQRCQHACKRYSAAGEVSRRRLVGLWRDVVGDTRPLPPAAPTTAEDDALFADDPWVEGPIHIDYGTNVCLGANVYINFNCTILDTCVVSIGARTLVGPNVSFYSGTHPLDPALRNGTNGPELGKEIHVGEDCWIGGSAMILPGVTIGRGATIGAGSVVTKDVPAFHVAAGNPARILRKVETAMDPGQKDGSGDVQMGAGEPMKTNEGEGETDVAAEEKLWRSFAMSEKNAAEALMNPNTRTETELLTEEDGTRDIAAEEKLWRSFAASEQNASEAMATRKRKESAA